MKTLSFWKKPLYSGLVFFGTIAVLTIGYAAWNSTMSSVISGNTLTASGWNAMVENINTLNTRLTSAETTITNQATSISTLNTTIASQTTTISTMNTTITNQASTIATLSPTGAVMAFNLTTCPTGWSPADGSGGRPDLRGEFIRGLDNGRGVDSGRTIGSFQNQDWKGFYQTNTGQNWSSGYSHNDVYMGKSTTGYVGNLFTGYWSNGSAAIGTKWDTSEVRPRNVALLYCVKN